MAKNLALKQRPYKGGIPYETWVAGSWTWHVLKKWQADDDKPGARWFCQVITPFTSEDGDLGDVYVSDIKSHARLVWRDPAYQAALDAQEA